MMTFEYHLQEGVSHQLLISHVNHASPGKRQLGYGFEAVGILCQRYKPGISTVPRASRWLYGVSAWVNGMARHPSRGMMGSSAQRKGISRQQCGCENAAGTRIEQSSRQDPSVA
ncbi:hypothetical protein TEQG_02872 [Trichophyton equinum CBS 127.97]|uniref:Uncharacterized protein n=1 Tax=Trichophyton equinum (strain ATCC MYA-4606 / CBS 127.97) TaxID=559882 RepID=F2PPM0_TRIEC|nr:hypothetical protein TEQG_02872 [Trichophyton equinum CBS 127.97]